MPERIELTDTGPKRRPIDAGWSKGQKIAAGVVSGVLALGVLGFGGVTAWQSRPVGLPTSAEEAIAVVQSGRVDRMDEARRRQYLAEAGRLLREMPREEARGLWRDEKTRGAVMDIGMEMMDEGARRFARGDSLLEIMGEMRGRGGRPGGGPPRGERGEGRPDGEREELSEEERAQRRAERRDRFTSMVQDSLQSGNAQSSGLRGEFFKRMFSGGGGFGGGRGGRGGGGGRGR